MGEGDPSGPGGYLIYSKTLCFARGTVVAPSFQYLTYAANARAAYMQMFIEPFTGQTPGVAPGIGGAALSTQVIAPAFSANTRGDGTPVAFTVPTTGRYLIKIVWTFSSTPTSYAGGCASSANDIGMFNLKFNCTP